ncbi:MAG: ABC transporter permease [Anaerolineae bacterium]|nr:ABC transporter permease [Anaerolineae bacterium]
MLEYLGNRILLLIPTLIVVSIVSFTLIQLPPGDYLTTYIASLAAGGQIVQEDEIEALKRQYGLDQPMYMQYLKWVRNMLRGDFGMSLEWQRPVSDLIWDRLLLTFVISFSTIVFAWSLAIPIGIYSATHQYAFFDYFTTFLGFVGLATPNFMLALIFLWVAYSVFDISIGGLFSPEYVDAAWSWGRVWDLFKHIWIPLAILGTSGTAGLIRTMRANMLDELRKPYVTTARAKGLTERQVVWKYPVRVALNPFVSTVGWALPGLISGSTITAMVLSLPTAGPLLIRALMNQDMFLAGSFLMMLSFLTVIGTLISDVLLAMLDPRIRYGRR